MMDETVMAQLSDTKAAAEVRALDRFYKMLAEDEDRAFYGEQYIRAANENNAIDTLLITDALFR
jgi:protein pelota